MTEDERRAEEVENALSVADGPHEWRRPPPSWAGECYQLVLCTDGQVRRCGRLQSEHVVQEIATITDVTWT